MGWRLGWLFRWFFEHVEVPVLRIVALLFFEGHYLTGRDFDNSIVGW